MGEEAPYKTICCRRSENFDLREGLFFWRGQGIVGENRKLDNRSIVNN